MPLVTLDNEDFKNLKKFVLKCNTCNSDNCKIDIDWAAYPSASWNTTKVICIDCHEEEIIYETS